MTALRTHLSRAVASPWLQLGLFLALLLGCYGLRSGTVQILSFVLIGVIFAQSINLLTGLAGQISLGHAGFFGLGAYGAGILAKTHGLDVALAVPCAVLIASAAANAWAEEMVMVGYLLTRLRQLGWSENRSLAAQAVRVSALSEGAQSMRTRS